MCNKKIVLYFVFIFCLFASACSQAVVIDFDDLERDYPDQVMQLTDQYANKGVIFDNAYLASWPSENSITGPGFSFSFVGELPVYVSFVLNNLDELKNSVLATGPNNFLEILSTEGGVWGVGAENSTPYMPNQKITLQAEFGISYVHVASQTTPYLDDLVFHYATEVPEPEVLILFLIGLLSMAIRRLNIIFILNRYSSIK
ncbi:MULTISPECIES: PEP-CTERM sorting domain-containing protein [unclassified Cellvibrio]|uniref:PEP-CTERM sorting domain-containing protein n=1 Tax=unclassified Cellvibrio TaxID=2624793 RepID=UPI0012491F41|nr:MULTISPECIES: PEP-CTERM sorting domain-containing protein [unclassified Cellvibrio]QEY13985.1 PEP-CTERM sorting domain-containing protein [Cellvibrio sp. KY-YJ-3]UUA74596.1 PEP-CTERM sorting domain-containing protein [Cellvibrio sp. QJXJ]